MVMKLRESSPRNAWSGAKCHIITVTRGNDPFFSDDESDTQEAVDFCNGTWDGKVCPLRDKCLSFALTNNQKWGVWGGTNEITRRAIRKKWPSKGGKPNSEWKWLSEEEALVGLSRERLKKEIEDESRNLMED